MTQFRTFTDAERAALKLHGLDTHRPSQLSDTFVAGLRYARSRPADVPAGAPGATDAERAAWLADKIVACGDYANEAAAMLRRWPAPSSAFADDKELHDALVDWHQQSDGITVGIPSELVSALVARLIAGAAPTDVGIPITMADEVHPCGREYLLDLFDEYADATDDGYWKETAAEAARKLIEALQHELKEHGAADVPASERYEAVGQFISSDGKGRAWAKVAKEYENDPDTVTLYRRMPLPAGVGGNDA